MYLSLRLYPINKWVGQEMLRVPPNYKVLVHNLNCCHFDFRLYGNNKSRHSLHISDSSIFNFPIKTHGVMWGHIKLNWHFFIFCLLPKYTTHISVIRVVEEQQIVFGASCIHWLSRENTTNNSCQSLATHNVRCFKTNTTSNAWVPPHKICPLILLALLCVAVLYFCYFHII
jgi:hypothetical protein